MSYNSDQVEYPLPDNNNNNRKSAELLPRYFRTDANKKFLNATLDQILQPGVAEKLNGFFGRKTAKAFSKDDNYISDIEDRRENYQFEPVSVIKDNLDNVIFYKDYNDYIAQIEAFGGNVDDHSELNSQEYYAWNPNIDWDKFVNFREYYWLPNGPTSVDVFGNSRDVESTYKVTVEEQGDSVVYKFSPPGLTANPTLQLYRGQTYRFEIDCPQYPIAFSISRSFKPGDALLVNTSEGVSGPGLFDAKLYDAGNNSYDEGEYVVPPVQGGIEGFVPNQNVSTLYNDGVTKTELGPNDQSQSVLFVEKGIIEFTVHDNAPDALFYISNTDIDTSGIIKIFDIEENSEINVEDEIIGKKTYSTVAGFDLSNGMKIKFIGNVEPQKYKDSEYIVEGVGESIKLIDVNNLVIPASYTEDVLVPFGTTEFDNLPYSNANSFAGKKDYIVINRASRDRNAWTRYNRWFHRDVIEKSAEINGFAANIDQSLRAKRPIIEFESGLKLYQFGTEAKQDIDLIDTFTKDVFSNIEGQRGYNIDGVDLVEGMRVLFAADTDVRVNGKIYKVEFIVFNNKRQIALREEPDTEPLENQTVLVKQGLNNRGTLWYYNGEQWIAGQEKRDTNQPPLFDLYDENLVSLSDVTEYNNSSFRGNKVFSYRENTATTDSELGFSLSYRNIENSGDILFDFNLLTETVEYQIDDAVEQKTTDTAFLRKYDTRTNFETVNGWTRANFQSQQTVLRQYVSDKSSNTFLIDVYDNSADIEDLWVRVYKNNKLLVKDADYAVIKLANQAAVQLTSAAETDDVVLIKTRSSTPKNSNGFYEFPYNLERNPLNENVAEFTLGQVNDHVDTMIEDLSEFTGNYPGTSNLRDLGDLDQFGKKFLQHSGPINLSLFHITDETANIIKSLKFARYEYGKFKRLFLQTALNSEFDGTAKEHVDYILQELNRTKTNTMPFYFSDMLGYLAPNKTVLEVEDAGDVFFALEKSFTLNEVSDRSVNVYLNDRQLVNTTDYYFNDDGFCVVTAEKQQGDILELYEYENTVGSYIPPTPTKLGLYPKFVPEIFVDDTYITGPVTVIQGHDGSITKAFGDYRDDLVLELELRIFNNLKQPYNEYVFDINDFAGGAFRNGISKQDLDSTMISDFIQWLKTAGNPDYTTTEFFDQNNSLTFNYRGSTAVDGEPNFGFWRAIYRHYLDTDRPHSHPWEILGYTVKPSWWQEVYGPAPYTRDNLVLWEDLQNGIVREPDKPIKVRNKYKRPGLLDYIPVDDQGNLLGPLSANLVNNFQLSLADQPFRFGDSSPVETAWRRSSEYPFSVITAFVLNRPAKSLGLGFDLANLTRSVAGQLVLKSTGKRLNLKDVKFPNTCECSTRSITSGLVNYIYDYLAGNTEPYFDYINRLRNLQNQLAFKLAGFTDKQKFRLLLDSRTPDNEGNVFVPEENYEIILNKSSAAELISYSGVIIEKATAGFIIRGYDNNLPEFRYQEPIPSSADSSINVGGITETFFEWTAGRTYTKGSYVKFDNRFYRTLETHTSGNAFDGNKFRLTDNIPITGGAFAKRRTRFSNDVFSIRYGTLLTSIQDVVDFLYGYIHHLETLGFKFEYYNNDTGVVENKDLTVREFLFWTTQNWQQGTVITLSPGATELSFEKEFYTVDNIFNNFYDYSLLKSDGEVLRREFTRVSRDINEFKIRQRNTADGVYALRLPLVQTEHVVLLDNRTVFNDIVYDPAAGYRQERIKALGYRTADWDGSFNIPGFVYDDAFVSEWRPFTDYRLGDTVKYKEFYYTATEKITGAETFDARQWERLESRPQPQLLTNLEYKTNQFADFYDLDTDNFDVEQQKFAQHLIGYQNRKYLQNIINDDVSQYKFYQGFIQDKGTRNALDKLFDALSSADKESLEFYEEWAVRESQYGASDGFSEIEYKLPEEEFRLSPQPIELVENIPQNVTDLIYRITPDEVYVTTENYNHRPFPIDQSNSEFAKTAGFVDPEDVEFSVLEKDEINSLDVNQLQNNDRIWVAKEKQSWNVYQAVSVDYNISGASTEFGNQTDVLVFEVDRSIGNDIELEDFIAVTDLDNLSGFYEIQNIQGNRIVTVRPESAQGLVGVNGTIKAVLKSVKTTSAEQFNRVAELYQTENSLVWLSENNTNKVYKNAAVYTQDALLTNPQNFDNDFDNFGSSLDADNNNTVLAIGSPEHVGSTGASGIVNVYTRGSDFNNWILTQTIGPPVDVIGDTSNVKFGKSVAVSSDSKYLAVGAPGAGNVLTRFEGEYSTEQNYSKGDIVLYNNSLWTATVDVSASLENTPYTTFDAYSFFASETDSTEIDLLIVGNYGLPSQSDTDHILVRAPKDMYDGTEIGDKIVLRWNTVSSIHPNLNVNQPFDGLYPSIDSDFLSRDGTGSAPYNIAGHEIQNKLDHVLTIRNYAITPTMGSIVFTATATGEVVYLNTKELDMVLYVKTLNGSFNETDTLFFNDIAVGEYNDDFFNLSDSIGGYWLIATNNYTTSSDPFNWADKGRGLVYRDVLNLRGPDGDLSTSGDLRDSDDINEYYNIRDYIRSVTFNDLNDQASFLTHLSYTGIFDQTTAPVPTDFWVFRAPADFTGVPGNTKISQGDTFGLYLDDLGSVNLSNTGLTFNDINKNSHTVFDLWDGYIDMVFDEFPPFDEDGDGSANDPIQPSPKYREYDEQTGTISDNSDGDTVIDAATGATAKVMFYQRFFNSVRLYVKEVDGNWSPGSDYGEPSDIRRAGTPNRTMGTIKATSLTSDNPNEEVGFLVVVQNTENFDPGTHTQNQNPEIVDQEYWIYKEISLLGAPLEASIPSTSNNDWQTTRNLPASASGNPSNFTNEGIFAVYSRRGNANFALVDVFTLPTRNNNTKIGSRLKFANRNNLDVLFVGEEGNNTVGNSGKIHVVKNGTEGELEYSWEQAIDKDYRGNFDPDTIYAEGSIVLFENSLYKAQTNIPGIEQFNASDWSELDTDISRLGFIPNTQSLRLSSEEIFDPENGIERFVKSFDSSSTGTVLATGVKLVGNDSTTQDAVAVYREIEGNYIYSQLINDPSAVITQQVNSDFGSTVSLSSDGKLLAVGNRYNSDKAVNQGTVYIYKQQDQQFVLQQELTAPNREVAENFGYKLDFDGNQLAVSSISADMLIPITFDAGETSFDDQFTRISSTQIDSGIVYLYERVNDSMVFADRLDYLVPRAESLVRFGESLTVSNNHVYVSMPYHTQGTEMVKGTNGVANTVLVSNANTFSKNQEIVFVNHQDSAQSIADAGLEEDRIYFVRDIVNNTEFTISNSRNGEELSINTNSVAEFRVQSTTAAEGFVLDYRKPLNSFTWTVHKQEIPRVDLDRLKGLFLYNTRNNQLIENLDVIDPVQGKIAGIADQEIAYKTFYDPAFYNFVDGNEIESATEAWAERYVGKLWWNLETVRFYNAYQSDVSFQTNYWNKTFPGSSIDIYEWVETRLSPQEWDTLSGTEEGNTRGISGTTLYGNLRYTQKRTYDSVAQRFRTRYYYWVRNKIDVPNTGNRKISAQGVADLIANPDQQGYRYVGLFADNRFALYNCGNLLVDSDVAINFRYWTIENQEQNIHSQYQVLTDGLESSRPNRDIERKWFDSLVGFDEFGRPVPDPTLSEKQKYGTLFKPRQSWYKNRTEALKQVIERANSVLIQNLVVDDFDISRLSEFDPAPSAFSRLYDLSVDSYDELQFIGTANIIQAKLRPVIRDGAITDIIIDNPGRGYRVPPTIKIEGSGEGAKIDLELDSLGKISKAEVTKGGKNYVSDTVIDVRKFSVLVQSDRLNNDRWVIYERNPQTDTWNRRLLQEYDVRPYWQYTDWYSSGYNQFTQIDREIDQSYELALLNDEIGSIVKIRNIGSGGWLLLEKINNEQTADYSVNYKTIGRQNGTVQFLDTLYNVKTNRTGFDAVSFDSRRYDNLPTKEVRVILETLRDSLFVDNLAREYNRLFFAGLRYAFSEQSYIDWAFKTSFVQAKHNVGELRQRINFKNDSLPSYEDYVKEAKPFKTKIRQYVSAYDKLEPTNTAVADFDLPPRIDSVSEKIVTDNTVVNNSALTNLSEELDRYPNRFWKDNVGYKVTDILIANPGSGYTQAPSVLLEGGGGTGATAIAYISAGKLTNIKVTDSGSGYISAPRVIINGNIAEGGESATASAVIGSSVVRSTFITSKFDRVSGNFLVTNLQETETFIGTGSTTRFGLKWPMDVRTNTVDVFVNGIESLRSEYSFTNRIDNAKSYARTLGEIEFTNPPSSGSSIEIQYRRNVDMLNAQDRINLFYNPTTGMIGNDVAQIMEGIDYGGVEVKSLEFDTPQGWDAQPWGTGQWDTYDNTFEDEVFRFDNSTTEIVLSKPLEEGITYNVYLNGVRIDDPLYDGSTATANPNAQMSSLIGDGVTQTLFLENLKLEPYDETGANTGPDVTIESGTAQLVIRKSTSDGSFTPDPLSYDTQITGGDLAYTTAQGINAEDIIVDGDGFVTPTTSKGPEELVPGQIVDTLDISVYQRQSNGGSLIYSDTYIADGTTSTFELQTQPNSSDAVFVRYNKQQLDPEQYIIDYSNNSISLEFIPSLHSEINIITLGVAGDNILSINEIIGDGSTTEFVTGVQFNENVSLFANINGEPAENIELENQNDVAVLKFSSAPASGSSILYGLFESDSQSYSQVKRDVFIGDGSTANFQLSQTPFAELPLAHKIIVKVDGSILNAGYNQLFTLTSQTVYQLQLFQKPFVNVVPEDVEAYLNGRKLEQNIDYLWSVANTTIELLNGVGNIGDTLEVFVTDDGDYQFANTELILEDTPSEGSEIEVIQFSNHDPQDISRISYDVVNRTTLTPATPEYLEYHTLTTGLIRLRSAALDAQYVWVIKNGTQLTPSVDYYVVENRQYVKVMNLLPNDTVEIIHFSAASKSVPGFGFRQFKDMLNRTHFKRLNDIVKFELSQDLHWYDLRIELLDGTDLPEPNKEKNIPGVLFVNGERIEYFVKDGNSLRQLRRGTLGTGVPAVHPAGTRVQNQSVEENIPYKDELITQVFVADGQTSSFQLDFAPTGVDEFEVFAAGKRLRKQAISVYDHTIAMDSPEGDSEIPAEYSLNGNELVLAKMPAENQKIIVVRKQGLLWSPLETSLSTASNDIARFLRAASVDSPE